MSKIPSLPRLLIIDDLFGRTLSDSRNEERASLCGQYLLNDITGDEAGKGTPQRIKNPIAEAFFCRGQAPTCSNVGDIVENDLQSTLKVISEGWIGLSGGKQPWALVLLDLCFYTGRVTRESHQRTLGMPEGRDGDDDPHRYFGLRILEAMHTEFPDLPVLMLSSRSREEVSREFSVQGALGFLPREAENSRERLADYLWRHGLFPDFQGLVVGHSKAFLLTLRAARRAARADGNLLIRGEPGTGKDLLARFVHQASHRSKGPFVSLSLPGIPDTLAEDTLFGHEAGAFADARTARCGYFETANDGVLLLDEIGDASPALQAKLLRAIEHGEVQRLGSDRPTQVDVRVFSATNVDIEGKALAGVGFRLDLLERLREGGTIYVPALRERKEDIPLLVEWFVRESERNVPEAIPRQIDESAMETLYGHDWPGNVRELRNCIATAVQNHPDVEHLVAAHLDLPAGGNRADLAPTPMRLSRACEQTPAGGLNEVLRVISTFSFESSSAVDLAAKLPAIQGAYAKLVANYLRAALQATSRPTLDNPRGEVLIHPTGKLITGKSDLVASKAADIIKKLLAIAPEAIDSILADPVLKTAYENARRLRPPRSNSKRGRR